MRCLAGLGATCHAGYGAGPVKAAIKLSCGPAGTFDLSRSKIRMRLSNVRRSTSPAPVRRRRRARGGRRLLRFRRHGSDADRVHDAPRRHARSILRQLPRNAVQMDGRLTCGGAIYGDASSSRATRRCRFPPAESSASNLCDGPWQNSPHTLCARNRLWCCHACAQFYRSYHGGDRRGPFWQLPCCPPARICMRPRPRPPWTALTMFMIFPDSAIFGCRGKDA
jgi:hypothetical protein